MTDAPLGKKAQQAADSKARLIGEARALFQAQGYAQTSTEALLSATGLTRGALYHHFRDKKDLFAAVCAQMHGELGAAIEVATAGIEEPARALRLGSHAWLRAVAEPGRCRVLLLDAPAVLSSEEWAAQDAAHGYGALRMAVRALRGARDAGEELQADALAAALNGAMNQLARWCAEERRPDAAAAAEAAIDALLDAALPPA
ncbi:TetR family transcriptional regulator [Roseateles sp. DAIF2]|uniref:TetR/AcrR family transcriptional regulator n=1 Tax=Roseateles sp. DAIF2 TaxID=2714952 RepID=UPI0018A2A0B6|nr:TetR family transcriptional regulator [Roseateles sp. DAIF2]QPF76210.1 TetR family transcriptional regulator [Roseateles sp. DAIF2]